MKTSNSEIGRLIAELFLLERKLAGATERRKNMQDELNRYLAGRAHRQGQIAAYQYVMQLSPAMGAILQPRVEKLQKEIGPI